MIRNKRVISRSRAEAGSGMTEMIIRGMEENFPEEDGSGEYGEPFMDWTELNEVMSTSDLIDRLKVIPFRIYIRRYLLGKHGYALPDPEDIAAEKWPLTDKEFATLALADFEQNGCVLKKSKNKGDILFPYTGAAMTQEELKDLLAADQIKSDDLIDLAFGLGMSYGVLQDFLRKVCRRSGLNLWREKEFFAWLVFRFTGEPYFAKRPEAYAAIAKAYKNEKTTEKKTLQDGYRTENIRSFAERMTLTAAGGEESIQSWLSDPQKKMPDTLRAMLLEYRKVQNAKGDYVRTASRTAFDLWRDFREVCAEDIRSYEEGGEAEGFAVEDNKQNEADAFQDEENIHSAGKNSKTKITKIEASSQPAASMEGSIASGLVQIRYSPGRVFSLPQGVRLELNGSVFSFRENENADFTVPSDAKTALKIPVRSERPVTDPSVKPVTKAARFRSADRRFYDVGPSSSFKEKKNGKDIFLEGNLEIECPYGTAVAEGSIFIEEGSGAIYRSVRLAECPLELTAVSDTEVVKDQLKKAKFLTKDGKIWKLPDGMSVGNKKIGFGKYVREQARNAAAEEKENTGEQGVAVRYLYYSYEKEKLTDDMSLDPEHIRLLRENIFRPETKFSASKIYGLEKRKRIEVTRSDLLTLIFLNFAGQRQFGEISEENYDVPAKQWLAAFIQTADRILNDCGFGGVYRADPYDAMLSYLAAVTDEPLNAFRNLWGMILHE